MKNKCYKIYSGDYKSKNIFEQICYKIWLWCGVSPSGLLDYQCSSGCEEVSDD